MLIEIIGLASKLELTGSCFCKVCMIVLSTRQFLPAGGFDKPRVEAITNYRAPRFVV